MRWPDLFLGLCPKCQKSVRNDFHLRIRSSKASCRINRKKRPSGQTRLFFSSGYAEVSRACALEKKDKKKGKEKHVPEEAVSLPDYRN